MQTNEQTAGEWIRRLEQENGFVTHNGMQAVCCREDQAVVQAPVGPNALNCHGTAHGGFLFSLADTCAGLLALADGHSYVTLDASFHFLRAAKPGDIVSLSPACASFDCYPNFEARGRHYKDLVNAL